MTDLQIQHGHYYRSREGRIVGPMYRRFCLDFVYWCAQDTAHTCGNDGRHYLDGDPSVFDLVEDLGTTLPSDISPITLDQSRNGIDGARHIWWVADDKQSSIDGGAIDPSTSAESQMLEFARKLAANGLGGGGEIYLY